MPTNILMPALSPTMTEGNLAKWTKKEGDAVKAGDVIAEIETDKATMEVEAVDEGILGKILVPAGTQGVKVNDLIAVLVEEGESVGDVTAPSTTDIPSVPQSKPTDNAPIQTSVASQPAGAVVKNRDILYAQGVVIEPPVFDEQSFFEKGVATKTVREALRDAMAEEMRSDEKVYIMGEEVAEYQGAYKITQGLLQEFGDRRVIDTPITEHGFAGLGVGAFAILQQNGDRGVDLDALGAGGDQDLADHTFVDGFDFHRRLVGFDFGDHVAGLDGVTLVLDPLGERALLHGRRQGGHENLDWHWCPSPDYSRMSV